MKVSLVHMFHRLFDNWLHEASLCRVIVFDNFGMEMNQLLCSNIANFVLLYYISLSRRPVTIYRVEWCK